MDPESCIEKILLIFVGCYHGNSNLHMEIPTSTSPNTGIPGFANPSLDLKQPLKNGVETLKITKGLQKTWQSLGARCYPW